MVGGGDQHGDMALVAVADNVQHHLVVIVSFSFAAVFIEGQQVFSEELVQIIPFAFVAEGAQFDQDVAETGEEAVVAGIRQGIDNAKNILAKGNSEEIIRVMESNKDFMTMLNSGGFREKLQKVQGRMLITQSGNDTEVETLQDADDNTIMKVVVDLKSLDKKVMSIFEPFYGSISTINYKIKTL